MSFFFFVFLENKLEIKEVQDAMNMKQFLNNDKDKWLNPDLIKKITENPIASKLFSNPEYLNVDKNINVWTI